MRLLLLFVLGASALVLTPPQRPRRRRSSRRVVTPTTTRLATRVSSSDIFVPREWSPHQEEDELTLTTTRLGPVEDAPSLRTRKNPKWRVVAAWARWQRSGLVAHLAERERQELSESLAAYASALPEESHLLARLEIAEVMLTVGADGPATVAAFLFEDADEDLSRYVRGDDAKLIARDMRRLRDAGLWRPIVVSEKTSQHSAWLELDRSAAVLRRSVALATRDARALLAELAALVVFQRRSSAAALAVRAVHVHLPLAELLKNACRYHHPKLLAPVDNIPVVANVSSYDASSTAAAPSDDASQFDDDVDSRSKNSRSGDRKKSDNVTTEVVTAVSSKTRESSLFSPAAYAALVEEIEDRAYSVLFPETYDLVRRKASRAAAVAESDVTVFALRARTLLAERLATDPAAVAALGCCCDDESVAAKISESLLVTARVKTPASALRKMLRRPEEVRDVLGLRVVVLPPGGDDALHAIYSAATDVWPELDGRFKDYVRRPKPNGYQSLHTTVLLREVPMEIQIRTLAMHAVAETGVANHALYSGLRRDEALANELLAQPLHQRRLLLPRDDEVIVDSQAGGATVVVEQPTSDVVVVDEHDAHGSSPE